MIAGGAQSREPLTRARIVEAAVRIIDAEGLPALNMRRLGEELHVKAMAVYKHFPNKSAILDGVVESMLSSLAESTTEADWRESFRTTFLSLRALLVAHPNALPLVASRPLASPQLTRRLESTRDLLLRSGLTEVGVLHLLHAGISLTLGYLWLETGGFVGELPDDAPFLHKHAAATTQPNGDAQLTQAPPWSREEDYAAGLDLLLLEPTVGHAGRDPDWPGLLPDERRRPAKPSARDTDR